MEFEQTSRTLKLDGLQAMTDLTCPFFGMAAELALAIGWCTNPSCFPG
jgi:hypothetical protein